MRSDDGVEGLALSTDVSAPAPAPARLRARQGGWALPAIPLPWPFLPALASGVVAFAWILHEALIRLNGLTASAWDLGYDQQVVWNVSQGHSFYSSFAHANFLGIHFEIIFLLPALVERLWPDPRVLLIFAAAGLAATAPTAYLLIRALLPPGHRAAWLATSLAVPIPFWAASQQAARDDFHPENMALALALLAAWAGLRGHRRAMWALSLLVLSCKEDQVYTVAVAGLLVASYGPVTMRSHGRWLIAAAVAWLLVVTGIVQQLIRHGGYSDFFYYDWLLLSPSLGGIVAALTHPPGWAALGVMVAGMLGLPLLRPRWLALALAPMVANLLSHHIPQTTLQLHYGLLVMFPVIVAGALGARRWLQTMTPAVPLVAAACVPAVVFGFLLGSLPPGHIADPRPYRMAAATHLRQAAGAIPAGAPVAADDGLTPWLADRTEIHGFPGASDDGAYVVIDREAYVPAGHWSELHDQRVAELSFGGRRLLYDDGRFQVWSPVGA